MPATYYCSGQALLFVCLVDPSPSPAWWFGTPWTAGSKLRASNVLNKWYRRTVPCCLYTYAPSNLLLVPSTVPSTVPPIPLFHLIPLFPWFLCSPCSTVPPIPLLTVFPLLPFSLCSPVTLVALLPLLPCCLYCLLPLYPCFPCSPCSTFSPVPTVPPFPCSCSSCSPVYCPSLPLFPLFLSVPFFPSQVVKA